MRILGISGSLRVESYNTALLREAAEFLGGDVMEIVTPAGLPLYDSDLEGSDVEPVRELARRIAEADGVLIASPEYNHGVPGGLKNAIDWMSRKPFGTPLAGKPVALMSASTGVVGGARGQAQLKLVLLAVGADLVAHSEVLVGRAATRIEAGALTDETTRKYVRSLTQALVDHVGAAAAVSRAAEAARSYGSVNSNSVARLSPPG